MLDSLNKTYPFNNDLNSNLKTFVGIGLGIFLFLLFFQPILPKSTDFNNRVLVFAGFGAITILLLSILRILVPSIFPKMFFSEKWNLSKEYLFHFIFFILNSVAFVFFARYVGKIEITFLTVIIFIIMTMVDVAVLIIINKFRFLKRQIRELSEKETNDDEIDVSEENDVEIEIESENKSEYFHLFLEQIILIKSANNYIEIFYKNNDKISRRLIRNTLKSTEELFSKYSSLVRCHRSCIVNKNYIQKLTRHNDGLKLILFDYPHEINVSRRYALKVKEVLKQADL